MTTCLRGRAGFDVSGLTGAAFKDSSELQFERWAKIVKATGFSAE